MIIIARQQPDIRFEDNVSRFIETREQEARDGTVTMPHVQAQAFRLRKYAIPALIREEGATRSQRLGKYPCSSITAAHIEGVCLDVIKKTGKRDTSSRLGRDIAAVCMHGTGLGSPLSAPARRKISQHVGSGKHKPAELTLDRIRQVYQRVQAIDSARCPQARVLLLCLAHTAVRQGELRQARFEDIDWQAATPCLTVRQTKLAKHGLQAPEHVVPLSTQAQALLLELVDIHGRDEGLLFGGMSPNTAAALLEKALKGTDLKQSPHGFRRSFRTAAAEEIPEARREHLEAALGHSLGAVEAAYNASRSIEARRPLMQRWSDLLTGSE